MITLITARPIDWVQSGLDFRNLHHPVCRREQHHKPSDTSGPTPPRSSLRSHRVVGLYPSDEERQHTLAFSYNHKQQSTLYATSYVYYNHNPEPG